MCFDLPPKGSRFHPGDRGRDPQTSSQAELQVSHPSPRLGSLTLEAETPPLRPPSPPSPAGINTPVFPRGSGLWTDCTLTIQGELLAVLDPPSGHVRWKRRKRSTQRLTEDPDAMHY